LRCETWIKQSFALVPYSASNLGIGHLLSMFNTGPSVAAVELISKAVILALSDLKHFLNAHCTYRQANCMDVTKSTMYR